jgi:hypothetical protein
LDRQKSLTKGLRSITREEFFEVAKVLVQNEGRNDGDYQMVKQLREKYPAYDEIFHMMATAAKKQDETAVLHLSGMLTTFRILLHIAEK